MKGEGATVDFQSIEGNIDVKAEIGVILPTYCEAANIEKLIHEIESLNLDVSVLAIDDSSPDGTADTVRSLQRKYDNILLFVRPGKFGLGTAITDAFKIFMSLKNPPKYLITMDADYSHNPRDIPRLLSDAKNRRDLVIGSRYCKGGKIVGWSSMRKLISVCANAIARISVGTKVCDCTSGFRCYSTNFVKKVIGSLHSQTYEIQIETVRQAAKVGGHITETPVTFTNRKRGKSKLTLNEIGCFFSYVAKTKLRI
jgi:dolichol-phosphate mannosyltransferase